MYAFLKRISNACVNAVFPTRCMNCGVFFESLPVNPDSEINVPESDLAQCFEKIMAPFLCSLCTKGFSAINAPICSICGMPFRSQDDFDHPCGECLMQARHFRKARALGRYDQSLLKIIQAFKYKGKIQLAEPLGRLLLEAFSRYYTEDEIDLILPVPLHIRRFRKRGFNQAYLMIRNWEHLSQTTQLNLRIEKALLERKRWTAPQVHQGKQERRRNVKNAFGVDNPSQIHGRRILLIDDVFTTGATVNECAKVLAAAGALYVDVLTLARADFKTI